MLRQRHVLLAVLVPVLMLAGVVTGALLLPVGWANIVDKASSLIDGKADAGLSKVATAKPDAPRLRPTITRLEPPKKNLAPPKKQFGIDVARIDQNGTSVIAGLAKASARVTVMVDGVPIGTVTADENGEWVFITDYKFASPTPRIELKYGPYTPKLAALKGAPPARQVVPRKVAATGSSGAKQSVRDVTDGMIRRLEQLTNEADKPGSANGAPTANASGNKLAAANAGPRAGERSGAVTSESLPVPVKFIYRRAAFTREGRKAADLLLKYLLKKKLRRVVLTGHADERGSSSLNMRLSERRLNTIERFLREGGYKGELVLKPRGEAEKFAGVDRDKYSRRELWELDRRVEIRTAE